MNTHQKTHERRGEEEVREPKKYLKEAKGQQEPHQRRKEKNLIDMMRELMKDVKEIKWNQEKYQKELNDLKSENEILKVENEKIMLQMGSMETKMNILEKRINENNIIVSGMKIKKEKEKDIKIEMTKFVKKSMNIDIEIKEAKKIGEAMYKIELGNKEDKDRIMQNKSRLRQLKERIYINHEMTREEQEIQKKLKQLAAKERKEGKILKIGYQKIIIEGKEYRWDKERGKVYEYMNNQQKPKN